MKTKNISQPAPHSEVIESSDPATQCFNYQLDFLKLEYESINEIIKRVDEITQTIKNWTLLIWAGSLSLALGQTNFRQFVILTAVLPLPFWFVDAWWRGIQRTCIFRIRKISEFLNGPSLAESFQQQKLINFKILDPRGLQYRGSDEYKAYSHVGRTMRFKEVGGFYITLVAFSLLLGVLFIFLPQLRT